MTYIAKIKNKLYNLIKDACTKTYTTFRRIMCDAASGKTYGTLGMLAIGFVVTYVLFLACNYLIPQCIFYKYKEEKRCWTPFCRYYEFNKFDVSPKFKKESGGQFTITHEDNGVRVENKDSPKDILIKFVQTKQTYSALKIELSIEETKEDKNKEKIKEIKEIEWWKTNNIAKNNEVFKVERPRYYGWAITKLSYPTSTSALVSWIRTYGTKEKMWIYEGETIEKSPLAGVNDDDIKMLCGELESIFNEHCLFNKNDALLFGVRSLNGWCQFLCVTLFVTAGFCLSARQRIFDLPLIIDNEGSSNDTKEEIKESSSNVAAEDTKVTNTNAIHIPIKEMLAEHRKKQAQEQLQKFKDKLSKEYKEVKAKESGFRNRWNGAESPQWFVYRNGLAFFHDEQEKHLSLADIANAGKDMFATSRQYVHWMVDSIPALGFLGTVVGIGQTMMGTGSILTDELGKQQSRISEISLSLAFAFDTTLVALVLSLIMGAFLTHRIRKEDESIDQVQRQLIGKMQSS